MIGRLRKDRPIFLRLSERRTDSRPMRSTDMNNDCKLVSRERHPTASDVRVCDAAFGGEALAMLKESASRHALPVVTELMDVRMQDTFLAMGVDAIQVGTRNMQNFELLK